MELSVGVLGGSGVCGFWDVLKGTAWNRGPTSFNYHHRNKTRKKKGRQETAHEGESQIKSSPQIFSPNSLPSPKILLINGFIPLGIA